MGTINLVAEICFENESVLKGVTPVEQIKILDRLDDVLYEECGDTPELTCKEYEVLDDMIIVYYTYNADHFLFNENMLKGIYARGYGRRKININLYQEFIKTIVLSSPRMSVA